MKQGDIYVVKNMKSNTILKKQFMKRKDAVDRMKQLEGRHSKVPAGMHRMPDGSLMKDSDMPPKGSRKKKTGY